MIVRPVLGFILIAAMATARGAEAGYAIRAARVGEAPIITESMLAGTDGESINGPTLIRVPVWVKNPLGRYYLYFAHHAGKYIRLAYADRVEGPWKIHPAGVLRIAEQTAVKGHVASPEAVVDEVTRQIFLFYHGNSPAKKPAAERNGDEEAGQITAVAVSADGLGFRALNTVVGPAYLRVFPHGGRWYALNHAGMLRRCERLGEPFADVAPIIGPEIAEEVDPARRGEPGATPADGRPDRGPFRYTIRHVGTDVVGDRLWIYFSFVGHRPERILATMVELKGPAESWKARGVVEVLKPEREWEGGNLPLAYSRGGISRTHVNELRDPGIFREGDAAWLLYTTAVEHGLGLARVTYVVRAK